MSVNIQTDISIEQTENAEKILDKNFPKTFTVDSQHCIDTEIPAGSTDEQIDLYESSLIVASSYLIIETDQPIQVKLGLNTNTPIDVASVMMLTDPSLIIFITVPGSENARIRAYYGGVQT
jgi:hypothetical protein